MPKAHQPRSGSMQYWPRKRADRQHARIRNWPDGEAKLLGFAGYKVGMTHVMGVDKRKNSTTSGQEIPYPVTVIECPPIRIASVRAYKKTNGGMRVAEEVFVGDAKELKRSVNLPKKKGKVDFTPSDYDDFTILVHTQPGKTGFGKKRPELFEVHLGGSNEEKLNYIKSKTGQDIRISEIFRDGEYVDTHAITKGKGTTGPVKRFGIGLKHHKSEKGRRRPGSLGGWSGQQHFMYRVAMAGQHGYHQRTHNNIQILKISDKPEGIEVKGGWKHYGNVKNDYVLVKGSTPGPAKRLVIFTKALRLKDEEPLPEIQYTSTSSRQGR